MMLASLLLPATGLLLATAAALIVHPLEREGVKRWAPLVLAAALVAATPLLAFGLAPLWLQLSLLALLLLLLRGALLESARWLLAPLLFLAPLSPAPRWAAALLLVGAIALGALLGSDERPWQARLGGALTLLAPPMAGATLLLAIVALL